MQQKNTKKGEQRANYHTPKGISLSHVYRSQGLYNKYESMYLSIILFVVKYMEK